MKYHSIGFKIPTKFAEKLESNDLASVNNVVELIRPILYQNEMIFFQEFTDHGIEHLINVLEASLLIIPEKTLNCLSSKEISMLIKSVLIHDIALHIGLKGFEQIISNKFCTYVNKNFDVIDWENTWVNFLVEVKRYDDKRLENIFGTRYVNLENITRLSNVSEFSNKLTGEFIRQNHCRLAHEIALFGFPYDSGKIEIFQEEEDDIKDIIGLIARSHGINPRETIQYLKTKFGGSWREPYNIKIFYLMIVLRIADYFQIQKERANPILLKFKYFSSQFSKNEWQKHNAIKFLDFHSDDPEKIIVHAKPENSKTFVHLVHLFKDIQFELDLSWAIIGEIYGKYNFGELALNYRRIESNLDEINTFKKSVNYIPREIAFKSKSDLLKLLVKPLYNNNPSFGVRELIQNAVDACIERKHLDKSSYYKPEIIINITQSGGNYFLMIKDNGIGMNEEILVNYFFKAGATFRNSFEWGKKYTLDGKAQINRTGKFGIGVLSTFLLGKEIQVKTRYLHELDGLEFFASIDSEQVEIIKTNSTVGTTITIKLGQDVLELIENSEGGFDWFNWYLFKTPKIKVNIDNTIKKKFIHKQDEIGELSRDSKWNHMRSESFEEVYWSFHNYENLLLINGFQIPSEYRIHKYFYDWKVPAVSIIDKESKIELSLDRKSISHDYLPFEEELINSINEKVISLLRDLKFIKFGSFSILNKISLVEIEKVFGRRINEFIDQIYFIDNNYTLNHPIINKKLKVRGFTKIYFESSITDEIDLDKKTAYMFNKIPNSHKKNDYFVNIIKHVKKIGYFSPGLLVFPNLWEIKILMTHELYVILTEDFKINFSEYLKYDYTDNEFNPEKIEFYSETVGSAAKRKKTKTILLSSYMIEEEELKSLSIKNYCEMNKNIKLVVMGDYYYDYDRSSNELFDKKINSSKKREFLFPVKY